MDAEQVFKDYFDVALTFGHYDSGVVFFEGELNDMFIQLIIDTAVHVDTELYFDDRTEFTIEDYFDGDEWEAGVVVRVYEGEPEFSTSTLIYSSGETKVDDVYEEFDKIDSDEFVVDTSDFDVDPEDVEPENAEDTI